MIYSVGSVFTNASAATADLAIWGLWNPHASLRIKLLHFAMFTNTVPNAGWNGRLFRIIAEGTPNLSQTFDISEDQKRGIASQSIARLGINVYTVEPTSEGNSGLAEITFPAVIGGGDQVFCNVEIPPGAGVAFLQAGAIAGVGCSVSVVFTEDW